MTWAFTTSEYDIEVNKRCLFYILYAFRMIPFFTERFEKQFNNTGAELYSFKKGIHFVLINSMSMQNDGCYYCDHTKQQLQEIKSKIKEQFNFFFIGKSYFKA